MFRRHFSHVRPIWMFIGLSVCGLLACRVPRKAGFDDVEKILAARGITGLRWQKDGPEDAQVKQRIAELTQAEFSADSAVVVALLQNQALQATYEKLGISQADLVQAGLLRNPTIFAHAGFPISSPASHGVAWELSVAGEFLDLFVMPLKKRLARAEFERAKFEVAHEVTMVVSEVRAAYYAAFASQRIVELRKIIVDADALSAELAGHQARAGTLSELDQAIYDGLYAQATLDRLRAEQQAQVDREKLTRLLGIRTAFTIKWPADFPEAKPIDPSSSKSEDFAVEHRLDLAGRRKEVEAIRAALSATRATRWIGSLQLGADAHREPEGVHIAGPTLQLELPIFDQGQARVARWLALYREAVMRQATLEIEIRSEVREIYGRIARLGSAADHYKHKLLPLRERIVKLSQEQYNAMLLGVYQLILAKQAEVNAYRDYVETVRDYWIARAELDRTLGAPFDSGVGKEGEKRK